MSWWTFCVQDLRLWSRVSFTSWQRKPFPPQNSWTGSGKCPLPPPIMTSFYWSPSKTTTFYKKGTFSNTKQSITAWTDVVTPLRQYIGVGLHPGFCSGLFRCRLGIYSRSSYLIELGSADTSWLFLLFHLKLNFFLGSCTLTVWQM